MRWFDNGSPRQTPGTTPVGTVPWSALVATLALLSCATAKTGHAHRPSGTSGATDHAAMVSAPDRLPSDLALDAGRRPVELMRFLQVRPGMRVAEIGAAEGYTAELLARAVAPDGVVYAQNSRTLNHLVGDAWPRRLARPVMRRVVRVDREFESPLPPEAKGVALVVMNGRVRAAGFVLAEEGDFLRNPDDRRDWNPAPNEAGARRGTSDRFALRFVKP
jgi:predicted methyltransferase